jgi:hypothetical protein
VTRAHAPRQDTDTTTKTDAGCFLCAACTSSGYDREGERVWAQVGNGV